ncbi:hypothetical protein [Methanohalophilus sp. RSK]|uniref:hypothetical protein n=1 Tax=Methanohalophilus sp. RSK TaxID=2485783 RepID=UPI001F2DC1A2|nr:hypothetical protein [Methanohalophilus sp. RSK]
MKKRDSLLIACIAMVLCLCLIPSTVASTDEQNSTPVKDPAQLKMEALEAELGEEGMKEVDDYLALQNSLPDVVKASPYSDIAFAATDKESQIVYLTAIDESNLDEKKKEQLKADLQDIWNRYPDEFVVADNLVLRDVNKIMEKRFESSVNLSEIGINSPEGGGDINKPGSAKEIKWTSTPHKDYAYYACDGSAYSNYAKNAADDPDNSGFDPYIYRYYNHYEDAYWGVGGAPGRCDEFAASAIFAINNDDQATAHERFGYSSHYLTDPGIPFHSKGATDYLGTFSDALFNAVIHITYEDYVYDQWASGYEYKDYVEFNTQAISVNDPEQAVEDNADHSAQYYDYIKNEMNTNPNWQTDIYVAYYTAQCVQESAKYAHGLYDYIM